MRRSDDLPEEYRAVPATERDPDLHTLLAHLRQTTAVYALLATVPDEPESKP